MILRSAYTRMRAFTLVLILLGAFTTEAQSQGSCGVTTGDQYQWMPRFLGDQTLAESGLSFKTEVSSIPVTFHLVGKSNGDSRPATWQAWEAICTLNQLFEPAGFYFYLRGVTEVSSTGIFNDHTLNVNQQAMRALKVSDAVNVFVVNNAGVSGGPIVTGYYDVGDDWVVIARSAFKANNHILAHEMGHFFGLFHPHLGWDGQAWSAATFGNPAPALASDGVTPTELQNGSNCQTAGDRLCDTPPDYNFGLGWQQSCIYAGGAQDPTGMLVNPDEGLIMSYFSDSCRTRFSPEQILIMQADLLTTERAYLQNSFVPDTGSLATSTVTQVPDSMATLSGDSLSFRWFSNPLAEQYYLEIDRSPTFALEPKGRTSNDTTAWFGYPFTPGVTFYWRVFAYGSSHACIPVSATRSFKPQLTSRVDPILRQGFYLSGKGNYRLLHLNDPVNSPVFGKVISIWGEVIYRFQFDPITNTAGLGIDLSGFAPGIYLLILDETPGTCKLLIEE